MCEKVIFVFFDTNIFLHFKFISEIDWSEIFPDSMVNFVIAPCILKELDEQKYKGISKKQRNRAKQILKSFYKAIEQEERKLNNIKIEFLSYEPSKIIFENNILSETNIDDRLLASILDFSSNGSLVCLITDDLALILKARNKNINVRRLEEKYKLGDDLDENEKIITQLRKENLELKEKTPNLKLVFDNEKTLREYSINSPRDFSNYTNFELTKIKAEYLKKTLEEENRIFSPSTLTDVFTTPISKLFFRREYKKEEIDSYNKDLIRFYSEYEQYLNKYVTFKQFMENILNLEIYLFNPGNISAKNIRINLHFPDGFELLEKNEIMNEPITPKPPFLRSPNTSLDFLTNRDLINPTIIQSLRIQSLADQIKHPPNVSNANIKKTNSYDVDVKVQYCPHKHKELILSLFMKYESIDKAKSYSIDYKLIADDIADFMSGNLNVKILKKE